ncbi:MAG: Amuc_1101 family PilM-like pilus complex protein [Verrucomicrobiota bacterium]
MAEPTSFVALNIGSQRVSIAEFSATPQGGLLLKKYSSSELLGDPAADSSRNAQVAASVKELSAELGLKKEAVRYAISGQSVFTRFVKLPPLTEEKVGDIVEFEAQQNVPFPINEVVWDYQLLGGEDSVEPEAVLVAIKSDALNEINDAVTGPGLQTAMVDVAPMALYNAFRYNYSDVSEPALLVDIGARTTNLIYIEGNSVFTRSIPVGGSTITTSIAKEFQAPFLEAEQKKIEDGFVALGGAYADHEDEAIAAMSKVIRNTLTRLHAEVVRTNNFYRTQQGGSLPSVVYLCGATVSMPYIREFFTEKLNLPVEFFNPLRNVLVAPEADSEKISAEAHKMGELVGLGLRGLSSCPMELDLVPESVAKARELTERKPFFVLAGACVVAFLAAAGFFYSKGAQLAQSETAAFDAKATNLNRYASKIKEWETVQSEVDMKTEPFTEAVFNRIFWVSLLDDINQRFTSDTLWLTELEPLSGEEPVTESLFEGDGGAGDGDSAEGERKMIDAIRIMGLYRENPLREQVVVQFYEQLKESGNFSLEELDQKDVITRLDSGDDRWAQVFEMIIPLDPGIRIPVE